jgi:hypothetical protein
VEVSFHIDDRGTLKRLYGYAPLGQEVETLEGVSDLLAPPGSLPRLWELLGYTFPRGVRERLYEPSRLDLENDYLVTRTNYRGRLARTWLNALFAFRTMVLMANCCRAWLGEPVLDGLKTVTRAIIDVVLRQ